MKEVFADVALNAADAALGKAFVTITFDNCAAVVVVDNVAASVVVVAIGVQS